MKGLKAQLQDLMGDLGMPTIQIGSQRIQAAPRKALKTLKGFGDTVKVGDIVEVTTAVDGKTWVLPVPQRITGLFQGSQGPAVTFRDFDDGPIHTQRCVPLAGPPNGRTFRQLNANELATWFDEHRRLPDGVNELPHFLGRVVIENGCPARIIRAHPDTQMAYVVEVAAQLSGFDVVVSRTYEDPKKTTVIVKKSIRRTVTR